MAENYEWIVRGATAGGVLSTEQIDEFSIRFDLPREHLERLSIELNQALNPKFRARSIPHALGPGAPASAVADNADANLKSAAALIKAAQKKVDHALQIFNRLEIRDPLAEKREEDSMEVWLEYLWEAHFNLKMSAPMIEKRSKIRNIAKSHTLPNKGRLHIERRHIVCGRIFRAWARMGRPVSYTSHTVTSRRSGRLLDFVNAIVPSVTNPPTTLTGETLRREIKLFNKIP